MLIIIIAREFPLTSKAPLRSRNMYDSILYNLMELYPGVINFKLITLQIMLIIDNHTTIIL